MFVAGRRIFGLFCGLFGALLLASAGAAEPCRIAYDMGSSGIRAGSSEIALRGRPVPQADIDFLAPLAAGRNLDETQPATVSALNELPVQGGFPVACQRLGGGFSAWRLALQNDAGALIALLQRIRQESGVSVLVVPQWQEGVYGYAGARQLLGERLQTTHVLDIGGGSLQIAGAQTSWGEALGQKIWHRQLCQLLRGASLAACDLQPLSAEQLVAARVLLKDKLSAIAEVLPGAVTMTAISRPVSRGIFPVLRQLTATGSAGFSLAALTMTIDRLAPLSANEIAALTGTPAQFVTYLLSDMLLVEGLLQASGGDFLPVAELALTNLPGLLADEQAFAWGRRYDCYLQRLQAQGAEAFASDPATCP